MINAKSKKTILFLILSILININYSYLILKPKVNLSNIDQEYSNKLNLPLYLSDTSSPLLWNYQTDYDIQSVAISADGNYIVSGSKNSGKNEISLFHKNNSVPVWTNDSLNGEIFSVDISSNGSFIVAGTGCGFGCDNKVYLFEYQSSSPLWSYQLGNLVFTVAISSDGNYIIAGSKDDRVYLFHKSSSIPIWSYHTGLVKSVDISSDGSYIVVGSENSKLYLFERTSSTPVWSYTGDHIPNYWSAFSSVAISSDGNYIVGGTEVYGGTSRIYYFHKSSSTPLWNYAAGDYILSVGISSEGNYITAGGEDCNVYLFNKTNSNPLWIYDTEAIINSVSISAEGNYVAAGTFYSGTSVYLFNRNNSEPLWKYTTADSVFSVGISSDGNFLTAGGGDNNVYLFRNEGAVDIVTLFSDAKNPDTNGEFYLYWNFFIPSDYIWIYQSNNYIDDIDENVILIDSGPLDNTNNNSLDDHNNTLRCPYLIRGLKNGTYYFRIRINNSVFGDIYSNCLKINVEAPYYLEWYRLWGESVFQGGKGLCIDSIDNVYQTGYIANGPHGGNDGILIKANSSGIQLWNKTFGGSSDDVGMDVCVDSTNNLYVVGDMGGIFTAKYNSIGKQIWNTSWNDIVGAIGCSVDIDSEDNIYVAGYAGDSGSTDLVFIKYYNNGTKIWQRTWGGYHYEGRYGLKLIVDSQDHLCVAAQTNSFGAGDSDAVIIKYDKFGTQLWNETWGGVSIDGAEAITIDSMDNILIAGYTESFSTNGYRNLFIAKFNNSGFQIWNKTWEGIGGAFGKDMIVDSNGHILLTGYTYDSSTQFVYLLMYDGNGKVLWNTTWGDDWSMMNEGWGIDVDSSDNIYISGYTCFYDGRFDQIVLLKYTKDLNLISQNGQFTPILPIPLINTILVISYGSAIGAVVIFIIRKRKV